MCILGLPWFTSSVDLYTCDARASFCYGYTYIIIYSMYVHMGYAPAQRDGTSTMGVESQDT